MLKKSGKIIFEIFLVAIGVLAVVSLYRTVEAGSLTPSAVPAATMRTLEEAYNALAGTFDSSGVTASSTGNAIAISRCMITRITGGSCS